MEVTFCRSSYEERSIPCNVAGSFFPAAGDDGRKHQTNSAFAVKLAPENRRQFVPIFEGAGVISGNLTPFFAL